MNESAGTIRVVVAVLEGFEVLNSRVIESVQVQLVTAVDTALGIPDHTFHNIASIKN